MLVAVFIVAQQQWNVTEVFSRDNLLQWMENSGRYAPIFYMALMTVAIVVSPIPSLPLDIAAGMYFGPLLGTIYSVIGATLGATISFLLARWFGRSLVERVLRGHIAFCTQCSDKLLVKIVFFSRLLPVVSFDVISYGAGLTRMSIPAFVSATAVGMVPLTFLYNYGGATLRFDPWLTLVIAGVVVGFFFVFPHLIERYNLFHLQPYFVHDSPANGIETASDS